MSASEQQGPGTIPTMRPCGNCGWLPVRATTDLCVPCWRYQHRTGRARPAHLILRHLHRTIERELTRA